MPAGYVGDFDLSMFSDSEPVQKPRVRRKRETPTDGMTQPPKVARKRKAVSPTDSEGEQRDEAYEKMVAELKKFQTAQKRRETAEKKRLEKVVKTEVVKAPQRKRRQVSFDRNIKQVRTYVINLLPVAPSDDDSEENEGQQSQLIIQTSNATLEPSSSSSQSVKQEQ
jgi:hypothetical protein